MTSVSLPLVESHLLFELSLSLSQTIKIELAQAWEIVVDLLERSENIHFHFKSNWLSVNVFHWVQSWIVIAAATIIIDWAINRLTSIKCKWFEIKQASGRDHLHKEASLNVPLEREYLNFTQNNQLKLALNFNHLIYLPPYSTHSNWTSF